MAALDLPAGVTIDGAIKPGFEKVLTKEAVEFIADLQRRFNARREELLAARVERQKRLDAGEKPDFLPETAQIREAVDDPSIRWVVALRSQVERPTTYGPALRKLTGGRPPVVVVQGSDDPGQVQIQIFERAPASQVAAGSPASTRR